MTVTIGRRELLAALGGAAAAWPLAARGQQPIPIIGSIYSVSAASWTDNMDAFRRGLAEVGFVDGRNVAIDYRWADGRIERMASLRRISYAARSRSLLLEALSPASGMS
jgi:putative ABC transport system substrate-binding protein